MRSTLLVTLLVAGCASNWELRDDITGEERTQPYFQDPDGDGWGDPFSDYLELTAPDFDQGYTVRNRRDCEEGNADVTGRIGSICPEGMVVGGADYFGQEYNETEFVTVYGTLTETVWVDAAEDACGEWGWGGQVATFGDVTELFNGVVNPLKEDEDKLLALPAEERYFAGFVGLVRDDTDTWVWEDTGEPNSLLDSVLGCEEDIDDLPTEIRRLALVIPADTLVACWGTPDQALPPLEEGETPPGADYTPRYGHFVCSRNAPDPTEYPEFLTEEG